MHVLFSFVVVLSSSVLLRLLGSLPGVVTLFLTITGVYLLQGPGCLSGSVLFTMSLTGRFFSFLTLLYQVLARLVTETFSGYLPSSLRVILGTLNGDFSLRELGCPVQVSIRVSPTSGSCSHLHYRDISAGVSGFFLGVPRFHPGVPCSLSFSRPSLTLFLGVFLNVFPGFPANTSPPGWLINAIL